MQYQQRHIASSTAFSDPLHSRGIDACSVSWKKRSTRHDHSAQRANAGTCAGRHAWRSERTHRERHSVNSSQSLEEAFCIVTSNSDKA